MNFKTHAYLGWNSALPSHFKVHYMPDKRNLTADAASRYPTLTNEIN